MHRNQCWLAVPLRQLNLNLIVLFFFFSQYGAGVISIDLNAIKISLFLLNLVCVSAELIISEDL